MTETTHISWAIILTYIGLVLALFAFTFGVIDLFQVRLSKLDIDMALSALAVACTIPLLDKLSCFLIHKCQN